MGLWIITEISDESLNLLTETVPAWVKYQGEYQG